jgi:hypothetical protein
MSIKQYILYRIINILKPFRWMLNKIFNDYWHNYPFGNKPKDIREKYLELFKTTKEKTYPEIEAYENEKGFFINKLWLDNLALHTQITIKKSELCYAHGRVLYTALSYYLSKQPLSFRSQRITIWETGTARGFSSLCMAKALYDNKQPGLIVTFDVLPHLTKMYWNCVDDSDGPRTRANLLSYWKDLLENYIVFHQGDTRLELPKVKVERIHFAFLDGAHTYKDLMFEFKQIKDRQCIGDIIVYDDYNPDQFPEIVKAVDEICDKYGYSRTNLRASRKRGYVIGVKNKIL